MESFKASVNISLPTTIDRDAAIQRFEYTVEAAWKTAQRYLEIIEGISEGSPKGAVRRCREIGILSDESAVTALEMIDDRNLTVYTYNEGLAQKIYSHLPKYTHLIEAWLTNLEKRLSKDPS